jgi:hypothetical protein
MLETHTYATTGHPYQALETPDGQYVLVTISSVHGGGSGIDVFRIAGNKLDHVAFQPMGQEDAQGIVLIPHTRILAVGLTNSGVAFLQLDDVLRGKAKSKPISQGDRAGSGYLAATPDGQFLFVANEYGDGGNISVVALHPDADGVHPETLAHIPAQQATFGVTLSPDGSRVYAVGEIVPPQLATRLPGHGVAELERIGCAQGRTRPLLSPNGILYVIDVAKATALTAASSLQQAAAARIAAVDSGCSPVRAATTPDGATVYVTARGDNHVLAFDAHALETDPSHAFRLAIPSGGEGPVGLELFNGGKAMLVANANNLTNGQGSIAVFDLSDPSKPVLQQTIKTRQFPRNINPSADGTRLYLTEFLGDELMVLQPK